MTEFISQLITRVFEEHPRLHRVKKKSVKGIIYAEGKLNMSKSLSRQEQEKDPWCGLYILV